MVTVNEPGATSKMPRTVAEDIHELGDMTKEMVKKKVEQLRAEACDCANERREKVRGVEHSIEEYIREQPLKSVLLAAGLGMVFGRFWMRR